MHLQRIVVGLILLSRADELGQILFRIFQLNLKILLAWGLLEHFLDIRPISLGLSQLQKLLQSVRLVSILLSFILLCLHDSILLLRWFFLSLFNRRRVTRLQRGWCGLHFQFLADLFPGILFLRRIDIFLLRTIHFARIFIYNWAGVFKDLKLFHGLFCELSIRCNQLVMNWLYVILKGGVAREQTLAKDAFEGLELHVDALSVVFKVWNRLKGLATALVSAFKGSDPLSMS